MKQTCYSPVKGVDDVIASKVTGWNKFIVANLRGMYDESHTTELDTTNLDTAVNALVEYRKTLEKKDAERVLNSINNPAIAYAQLKSDFTAEERYNRVSMIATMFSDEVDAYQEENQTWSRKEIINGIEIDGEYTLGSARLFNNVYESIYNEYKSYLEEGDTETAEKFRKVLNNWGALISFAAVRLRETEEVKLGIKINYVDDANPNNFNDNDMVEKFIMEESKREGWMESAELESSFGSIGKQVRKILGTTPVYKDGEVVTDDLGFPIMQNPVQVHQELLDVLEGISSEEEMIYVLRDYGKDMSWVAPILDELNDPVIRTQFYVDLKKHFQPYSIQLIENLDGGLKGYKTKLLNILRGKTPIKEFMTTVKLNKLKASETSIFQSTSRGLEISPSKLSAFKTRVIDELGLTPKQEEDYKNAVKEYNQLASFTKAATKAPVAPLSKFNSRSRLEKKVFLVEALRDMGINIDNDVVNRILSRKDDLNKLTTNILQAAQFGMVLTEAQALGNTPISYEDLIKLPSKTEKEGVLKEKLTKALTIISKNKEGLRLESRVRYMDNTRYSHVLPSYMGDMFDKIKGFQRKGDIDGLKNWIEQEFLNSPYFVQDGVILNKWLEELYNSDLSDEKSFASMFRSDRFLGTDDLEFENFTSSQHAIQLLSQYFAPKQISKDSKYAKYPVFILGDSGVSKFITAKRYSIDEIKESLYNVYKQEKRRMALTKAANQKLEEGGYELIENYSNNADKFTFLPFLNEKKYSSMISESNLKETVIQAIEAYMEDSLAEFTNSLEELNVLEVRNGQYIHLSQEVKSEDELHEVLQDYYWNTKLALINQLQMFTGDVAFYKGTEDLQKRYKGIYAPGNPLSILAFDKWNNRRYSEDGIERVKYFDEIVINSEETNPEFMEVIATQFGKDSYVYKKYQENALTDGQGFRTLDSYRKVMGMAGQWTEQMQNAYERIISIRSTLDRNKNLDLDTLQELRNLAVIFQPIKPILNGMENLQVNENDVVKIPVQHKYAEVVLIPELLPAGSKLRDLAYYMDDNVNSVTNQPEPIDMICTTKAVKVGIFGQANITDAQNYEELSNALNSGYTHQLEYKDYRIQTNVPEHVNSSQLFGTQVRKIIMSGIDKAKDYSNYLADKLGVDKKLNIGYNSNVSLNGRNLVRFYNSLVVANIVDSYDLFDSVASNPERVSDTLIQMTINNTRESKDNLISYSLDENGNFTIPLFEGGVEHDSSALLLSMFKKMVNKQAIKGGSAVQASAMGLTSYENTGDLKYVVDKETQNVLYAECEMPWDLNYVDSSGNNVDLKFEDWCNEDGTLKQTSENTPLIEEFYPGILDLIAYRIPTEREYSMINLKVVRFSNKIAGGTIKVPAEGTTISGFDFDIDKLYFMRREHKYKEFNKEKVAEIWNDFYETYGNIKEVLKETREEVSNAIKNGEDAEAFTRLYQYWEKAGLPYSYKEAFAQFVEDNLYKYSELENYDFNRTPLENSRTSRNNTLIDLISARLKDVETRGNRLRPGSFTNASNAARLIRELTFRSDKYSGRNSLNLDAIRKEVQEDGYSDPKPNYDPTNPMTLIIYNQQNQIAGKLIGVFANQNTNHAFSSLMEEFKLKTSFKFITDKNYTDLLHNPDTDTGLTVAEFLSASVDAVKDPVLNFLNLNTITADAGAVLARLGYTTEEIGLLFNQPVIRDICEYSFNNNISNMDLVIKDVLEENYKFEGKIEGRSFTAEELAKNLVNYSNNKSLRETSTFIEQQRQIALIFQEILAVTNEVTEFVRNTKFTASNAVGSTFGDMYAQQMRVEKYITSFVNMENSSLTMKVADFVNTPLRLEGLDMNKEKYVNSLIDNPLAYEQAMFDMNRKAELVLNKYFPYRTKVYSQMRDFMASLSTTGLLDADTINSLHSDFLVYILSQQEDSLFNSSSSIQLGENITSIREYVLDAFPQDLYNALDENPELKDMPIFKYMSFTTEEGKDRVDMQIQDVGGLTPIQKDEIRDSWGELINNEETSNIAQLLFLYNYYKLGFTYSPLAFMNLAPSDVKLRVTVGTDYDNNPISYVDFLDNINKGAIDLSDSSIAEFAKQYILNHLDNRRLVFNLKGKRLKFIKGLAFNGQFAKDSFTLDANSLGKDDAKPFLLKSSSEDIFMFKPVLLVDGAVYIASNSGADFNKSVDGTMVYTQVGELGKTNKSLQYNPSLSTSEAVFNISLENVSNTSVTPEFSEEINTEIHTVDEVISKALDSLQQGDTSEAAEILKRIQGSDLSVTIEEAKAKSNDLKDEQGNKIC